MGEIGRALSLARSSRTHIDECEQLECWIHIRRCSALEVFEMVVPLEELTIRDCCMTSHRERREKAQLQTAKLIRETTEKS